MRLVIESSVDRYYENLPTSNEVIAIIPDKYIDASRRNLVLIVCEAGREYPQIRIVNVTYATYMPLYYILLFPHGDPG